MPTPKPKPRVQQSVRRHLVVGGAAVFLLVGAIGGWAATIELAGAIIGQGVLVVESNVKKVQHFTGGVIGELNVREGHDVKQGEVLLRLDGTVTRANLAVITKSLDQLAARQARLEAEREGSAELVFPEDLTARNADPEIRRLMEGETNLFELRRAARDGQRTQLNERVAQLKNEVEGLTSQTDAKERELSLIETEISGLRDLWKKNLVTIQRVNELDRDLARLEGERGQLIASTAQARGKISEIELQKIQIDQDLRSEVAAELREIAGKAAELGERKVMAEDELRRIDIRSPQDGRVHQLAVHTIGGVAGPGEVLMLIVPISDALAIDVQISPQDIDQISPGQSALLRFSAFNQRSTPEINGRVLRVSPDLSVDQRTGSKYYTVRIIPSDGELSRLNGQSLTPGMPVEAFIKTGQRTALSYFTKPLADQVMRTFRGD